MQKNSEQPKDDRLLNKRDVCALLRCSPRMIERLASSQKLNRVKILGAVRYSHSEVLALMRGGTA